MTSPPHGKRGGEPEAFAMPAAGTRQVISAPSALVLLGTIFILLFCTEPIAARFGFAVAVTVAITSFVSLLSRRLLFASVIASSLVVVVFLISLEKQAKMNMGLHSYDLFFYLNADTLGFLWSDYRRYVVAALAAIVAATIAAVLAWRFDTTRPSRLASGLTLVAAIAAAGTFEPQASGKDDGRTGAGETDWAAFWVISGQSDKPALCPIYLQ